MNAPIDITNTILHTDRLILRPWNLDDLDDLYEYASVEGVGSMAGWKKHESIGESKRILESFINDRSTFAIEYQGKVIGSLGVDEYRTQNYPELDDNRCRELGYVLSKDYWNKGLMSEAVKEVIRYLFEEAGLDVILCGHFTWNAQSARVQEKCGFKEYKYGTYQTAFGTIEPQRMNILFRQDWLNSHNNGL